MAPSLLRLARAARDGARLLGSAGSGRIAHRATPVPRFAAAFSSPGGLDFSTDWRGPKGPDGLPTFVDWSKYGAVTPVQDQGDCSACWAFGATALVESMNYLKTKELLKLSEQQLIDGNNLRNYGCKSGSAVEGLAYILNNEGIVHSEDYPYTGVQGPVKPIEALGVTINGWHSDFNKSESYLKRLVSNNPVLVTIGADQDVLYD